jgi:hypothetical protein
MKMTLKRAAVAAMFAGLTSGAIAQTYSVNAVGYIKLVLPPGQTLVSTPFVKVGGGTPTITDVFGTNVPNGSVVSVYIPAQNKYTTYTYFNTQWYKGATSGQGTNLIHRGSSFWFKNPTTADLTVNLVGEVPGGDDFSVEDVNLPLGLSMVCFSYPTVTAYADSGLVAVNGDVVYEWTGANYKTYTFFSGKWYVGANITSLIFQPGKGYWYKSIGAKSWIQPKLYTWP